MNMLAALFTDAARLVTGLEATTLIGRAPSTRYAKTFPAPAVRSRGPTPNLYDRDAVLSWAAAHPVRCSEASSSGRSAPAPKPAPKAEEHIEEPTRYVLTRLPIAGGLLGLPAEADLIRSLRRDFDDGPCRRPRACSRFRTFLRAGEATADGQDAPAALLKAEAARDRSPAPAPVVGRPPSRVKARRDDEESRLMGWQG